MGLNVCRGYPPPDDIMRERGVLIGFGFYNYSLWRGLVFGKRPRRHPHEFYRKVFWLFAGQWRRVFGSLAF